MNIRWIIFLMLMIFCENFFSQGKIKIIPVAGINTENDEIVCGFMGDQLLISSNQKQDRVSDYQWNDHRIFQLYQLDRGEDFSSYHTKKKLLPFGYYGDEGTACYDDRDSVIYFSSSENYDKGKGSYLKIYRARWNGEMWETPELLPFCMPGFDYAHPFIDTTTGLMVFSSNRPGGSGGMDIWYVYHVEKTWTDPVNPGVLVNSPGHEIFPSIFNGDIYFSSNGLTDGRGYELFRAPAKNQWKISIQLPEPINSSANDVRIIFINKEKGFISSDRKGFAGGDDIFLFEDEGEKQQKGSAYHAVLMNQGEPVPHAGIQIKNDLNEIVFDGHLDDAGQMSLEALALNRTYRLTVSEISPSMYRTSVFRVMDNQGNMIKAFFLNDKGWIDLELLAFNYTDLPLKPNIDHSLLQVSLKGQIYDQEPGDVGLGEAITIIDEQGETVAVAYTEEKGTFQFAKLFPELDYRFRLAGKNKAAHIVVLDRGKSITLPVLHEEAVYQRLSNDEAVELTNEFNETVFISPNDIFIINRIYYSYNSAVLSEEAKIQLDHLLNVLNKNPSLFVALRAHTDARGDSESNTSLSDRRAIQTKLYLTQHGIDGTRIIAQGMGERQLLNHCSDGVVCSEAEHAINRRTDIRLYTR